VKKFILPGAIFIAVLLIVFYFSVQREQPQQLPISAPTQAPSSLTPIYRGINVETDKSNKVIQVLGGALRSSEYKGVTTLIYPSTISGRNLSVEINQDETIKRIMVPLAENLKFSSVSADLGPADLELYGKLEDLGYRLYVYATQGTALLANPTTDVVREQWYFPNTSIVGFQNSFGEGFSTVHVEVKP